MGGFSAARHYSLYHRTRLIAMSMKMSAAVCMSLKLQQHIGSKRVHVL